ncbi:MAG: hypothetical protein HC869_25755 [Rhodospirillales bacterium]|nr:hypothetical protein [Rhodospirillales bacterium]
MKVYYDADADLEDVSALDRKDGKSGKRGADFGEGDVDWKDHRVGPHHRVVALDHGNIDDLGGLRQGRQQLHKDADRVCIHHVPFVVVGRVRESVHHRLPREWLADANALAGGWIESMHFALSVYKIKPEPDMAVRIGEQKNTCAGILKLLVEQDKPEFEQLIKLYQDLNNVYSQIEMKYTFAEPVTDNANKITTINGKTEVNITPEQLTALTEKTAALRNYIIN